MSDANSTPDIDFEAPKIEELQPYFPGYEIISFIAQGGMGAVYRAKQTSLDREIAIKILPKHLGEDESFREQFKAEAQSMAKLNHPNLIGVYDFGEANGMLFIIMEFVYGKSLYHSAYGKQIDQEEASRIIADLCNGLAHAHDAGILHRDIKPANILLDEKANPKLGDFGLARPVDEREEAGGVVFGTPGYTAPEVINHPDAVDKRSDVFSLGAMLYELLTGKVPLDNYKPVSQAARCHPEFDKIIRRAIHPSPAMRYNDASELGQAIRDLMAKLGSKNSLVSSSGKGPITVSRNFTTAPLKVGGAGNVTSPLSRSSSSMVSSGGGWNLMKNFVIIATLVALIFGAFQVLKLKQGKLNGEKNQSGGSELGVVNNEEGSASGNSESSPKSQKKGSHQEPGISNKDESREESLERLKSALVAGEREEFPKGVENRGDSFYFFIKEAMTRGDAIRYAEAHGGHLACVPSEADQRWLANKIQKYSGVWVGAGTTTSNNWGWVDGSPWETSKPSGHVGILSKVGTIRGVGPKNEFPFYIQWRKKGSSAGELERELRRTAKSYGTPTVSFPAGSITRGGHTYYLASKVCSWIEAKRLAEMSGGHLAVVSDEREAGILNDYLIDCLGVNRYVWLGGEFVGDSWKWVTGEPFSISYWAEEEENKEMSGEYGLIYQINREWVSRKKNVSKTVKHFLIEWSSDHKNRVKNNLNKGSSGNETGIPSGSLVEVNALKRAAKGIVKKADTKHQKALKQNAKSYVWNLEQWLGSLPKNQASFYKNSITRLEGKVRKDGTIPNDVIPAGTPKKVADIINAALRQQKKLESRNLSEADKVRRFYIKKLKEEAAKQKAKGQKQTVAAIEKEIQKAGSDAKRFLRYLN